MGFGEDVEGRGVGGERMLLGFEFYGDFVFV